MSVYAVGDIQGCYAEFRQLLDLIAFDPGQDRLWLVGDLVNRGPESLSVLRAVRDLGTSAVTVLGVMPSSGVVVRPKVTSPAALYRRASSEVTVARLSRKNALPSSVIWPPM